MFRFQRSPMLGMALAAITSCGPAMADGPFVDPYTATSPSGAWRLTVEPSNAEGTGAAKCRMVHDGGQAWAAELELTLRECVVSDAGLVVGYAYDNGYMGWDGSMVVLAVGPDGAVLANETHARELPKNMIMDPTPPGRPRCEGLLLDADPAANDGGRVIVRVCTWDDREAPYEWWIYSLKDGKPVGVQRPTPPGPGEQSFSKQIDARMVPGTGLAGVHWMVYERGVESAVFELIDRAGRVAWSHRIEREYADRGKYWSWADLIGARVEQLEVGPGAAFATVSYSEKQRTRYSVQKDAAGAWAVQESGREEATPVERSPREPVLATTPAELKPLGEITLGTAAAPTAIDNIHRMCFDGRGRIGWVRWARGQTPNQRFSLVDRDGTIVADLPLALPENESAPLALAAWLDKDRWIVARTRYDADRKALAEAWFMDATTGALVPVEGFSGGNLKRICPLQGGGFIVLGSLHGEYTIRDQVTRYDEHGKPVDQKTEPGYGRGDSIQDVAVLTDGTIATLIGVADRTEIRLVRPGAAEPETWNVSRAIGDAKGSGMMYIADLRADKDGGVIVYDSANQNHLHRLDKSGKRWQSFHVTGPKGEPFRLYDSFAVDPDGRVWASDGSRLFRVGDDGRADLSFGGPPEGSMADPVALTIDSAGAIYAVEKGTAAVHVFDGTGKPVRVMRPEPKDTPTQDALAWIRVEPDGRVRYRMTYEGPIVLFDANGNRLGTEMPAEPWKGEEGSKWRAVSGKGAVRWEENGSCLRRPDQAAAGVQPIEHRPDGGWLVHIDDACVAPDGSLAALCSRRAPGSWGMDRGAMWLCLYGPDGDARETLAVPRTSMFLSLRYDGSRVLLCDEKGLTEWRTPLAGAARRYTLAGDKGSYWKVLHRPDGTISAWDMGSRVLRQFGLEAN